MIKCHLTISIDFDEEFYNSAKLNACQHLLELNITDPLYESNHTLTLTMPNFLNGIIHLTFLALSIII